VRDLIYDVHYCALAIKLRSAYNKAIDVSAPDTPSYELQSIFLDGNSWKISLLSHLFSFWIFRTSRFYCIRLFDLCPNFKHSNWWRHKVGHV